MTEKELLANVKNADIFKYDYAGRILMTDEVLKNTELSIVRLIDSLQSFLDEQGTGARVIIHCLYDPAGHVNASKHYVIKQDGKIIRLAIACDFHILGLDYLSAFQIVSLFLDDQNMSQSVGWGQYPDWNNPGFHIDVRGKRGRWGYFDSKMQTFDDTLKYAKHKFKRR